MQKLNSTQQLLYSLYVFCKTGEKCDARVRAILDYSKSVPAPKDYEPFAGDSPSVSPLGGDF